MPSRGGRPEDKANLVALVKELRAAGGEGFLITMGVGGNTPAFLEGERAGEHGEREGGRC